ncbi:PadR family transcriptional regulator [Bombilactobacillus bombi]|jgi:PadR family transcriptional regulator, regulatory protein PadR|uniref:PadR family transcriptional regulator n=1 Tax=Bombilactobacillus bombi TaxID=1303590 RepID=A0A417ZG17_9LACO|nr:PadR family transcriptional regulator [Bombilactobacillus bombi]MCO6541825.1 PadR family transcriptional regulator [Lactobacillus sp.]RHW47428.1 PadR family transcriptional regulator [Bombilactobacillus bombi]RHW50197.1 PadR family transcriptional regulator [Bombilactobacillus bombi]
MAIQISSEILEGVVLSALKYDDLYGYALTQQVQSVFDISESTIYPVLRRLKKNKYLTTYDQPYQGRNRRYYQLTDLGRQRLNTIVNEWHDFYQKVNQALEDDNKDD